MTPHSSNTTPSLILASEGLLVRVKLHLHKSDMQEDKSRMQGLWDLACSRSWYLNTRHYFQPETRFHLVSMLGSIRGKQTGGEADQVSRDLRAVSFLGRQAIAYQWLCCRSSLKKWPKRNAGMQRQREEQPWSWSTPGALHCVFFWLTPLLSSCHLVPTPSMRCPQCPAL
jgi:hypothetical protein